MKEDLILTFSNCIHVKKTYPFQFFLSFPTNVYWLTHATILAGIYLLKVSNKNKALVATMSCINDINQLKDYISHMSSWKNNIFHDKRQCKVLINNYKKEFTCLTTNHPTSNFWRISLSSCHFLSRFEAFSIYQYPHFKKPICFSRTLLLSGPHFN